MYKIKTKNFLESEIKNYSYEDGKYVFGFTNIENESPAFLKELADEVLADRMLNHEPSMLVESILKLDFAKQLYIVEYILHNFYNLSGEDEDNKAVEKVLSDKRFGNHRDVMLSILSASDDEEDILSLERLERLEKEYNVEFYDIKEIYE
jgi:hypothetical protein